ncbi:uncharacterized protein J3D65DRAFT_610462 [Phyllosticta citribraziliensis]|uniref:Uncharacterized protein n=1 Tax=Phyllosticta citribraziliensis TaxID=989973 RepID=A0ABR1MD06_9PEZI
MNLFCPLTSKPPPTPLTDVSRLPCLSFPFQSHSVVRASVYRRKFSLSLSLSAASAASFLVWPFFPCASMPGHAARESATARLPCICTAIHYQVFPVSSLLALCFLRPMHVHTYSAVCTECVSLTHASYQPISSTLHVLARVLLAGSECRVPSSLHGVASIASPSPSPCRHACPPMSCDCFCLSFCGGWIPPFVCSPLHMSHYYACTGRQVRLHRTKGPIEEQPSGGVVGCSGGACLFDMHHYG